MPEINPKITVDSEGYREFLPNMYLIRECIIQPPIQEPEKEEFLRDWYIEGHELHSSQSAFLIKDSKNLLFETLTPYGESFIIDSLKEILDGEPLHYLAISHPEANHAGNTQTILREFPEAELLVPQKGSGHAMFGLNADAIRVTDGETFELGDHTVKFHDPTFFDHAMHTWMSEVSTETLFTVDWLGKAHLGPECLQSVDEMESEVTLDRLQRHAGFAFVWLRYVDPEKTDVAIDRIQEEIDPSVIAPTHGQLIWEDVDQYFSMAKEAIHRICDRESPDYDVHTHGMMRFTQ